MKLKHTILALFVTLLALPIAAVGQDEDESTQVASNGGAIDNVVVTGQKSTGDLRRELWDAEDDFYSLYNKMNDENKYDVRCIKRAPVGSRIKNHTCTPVFLTRAIDDGKVTTATNIQTDPVIADDMARFREKMNTLIAADPELQAAVSAFNTARARYVSVSENTAKN
jgi:hypothetical protein